MSEVSSKSTVLTMAQSHRKVLETVLLICRDQATRQRSARVLLGGDWAEEPMTWLKSQVAALPKCELLQNLAGMDPAQTVDALAMTGVACITANFSITTRR